MHERLMALAKRIQAAPWNEPGTDKTWVLKVLASHQRRMRAIERARPVDR